VTRPRDRRIFLVYRPTRRVRLNVLTNSVECFVFANDMLVETSLPNRDAGCVAFLVNPLCGERFETPDYLGQWVAWRCLSQKYQPVHVVWHDDKAVE
jgi:hypothetical protein